MNWRLAAALFGDRASCQAPCGLRFNFKTCFGSTFRVYANTEMFCAMKARKIPGETAASPSSEYKRTSPSDVGAFVASGLPNIVKSHLSSVVTLLT